MHMMQASSIIRILLRRYWYLTMCAASIARDLGAESPKNPSPAGPMSSDRSTMFWPSRTPFSPYLLQSWGMLQIARRREV